MKLSKMKGKVRRRKLPEPRCSEGKIDKKKQAAKVEIKRTNKRKRKETSSNGVLFEESASYAL